MKAAAAAQEVRILGGQWRRSKLPVADRPGLRPTPSRVRETLFNWLGQDLSGLACIDAFAGTGALGLEAASRGATRVTLVERDAGLLQGLQALLSRLKASQVSLQRGDGVAHLAAAAPGQWDVVFLDPPFDAGPELFDSALRAARHAVAPTGFVYWETDRPWSAEACQALGFELHRQGRAGAVAFHLLKPLE